MEQYIKILEELKNIFLSLKYHGYINDIKKDISTDGVINAIENILKERQQDKEKIKELEEYYEEQNEVNAKFIPVSLVEETIEELIKEGRHYNANKIEVLQELLEKRK